MSVRIHKVKYGNTERVTFSKIKDVIDIPYLIEVQKNSFKYFMTDGIAEVFREFSPIVDISGRLELDFLEHTFGDKPKYTVKECKDRDVNYAVPLHVQARLTNKETQEVVNYTVFLGDFPIMTDSGSFIINGAERVVVSQLVRSPGVYCKMERDKNGIPRYTTTDIPIRGAWLDFEQDQQDIQWVHVDKTRKITSTTLIRALGVGTDEEIAELFGNDEMILATCNKDINCKNEAQGKVDLFRRLRPGEVATAEGAENTLHKLFFDPRRYDFARVGRFKYNNKLSIATRIAGYVAAAPIVSSVTGEILVDEGEVISADVALQIQNSGINQVWLQYTDGDGNKKSHKVLGNNTVDLTAFVDCDPAELGINERVYYPVLKRLLDEHPDKEELIEAIKAQQLDKDEPLVFNRITVDDIFASINYNLGLRYGFGSCDDIDHFSNRRVRAVGELLQNQFRIGISRLERGIREKMSVIQDTTEISPQSLINIRPIISAIKEFFGSSQLSQFMDQPNPIAELTHKRKLSALGRGGLNRDRAGVEVRDVHHSHYGRICPIETPEGQNIGLISSVSTYARVNDYGFIESPYRKIDKATGVVTNEVVYMTAEEEDKYVVAQANEDLDEGGHFTHQRVNCRCRADIKEFNREDVDYMDVNPKQLVSIATALIPFLENDDTNRALMGSNMQRQAVPLIKPEEPIIATGVEHKIAYDSGVMIIAQNDGVVDYVSADKIIVKKDNATDDDKYDEFLLSKFQRSNQSTCINQRPIVTKGDVVKKGDILADGPATKDGELALGRNILIGFMSWEGYNYEDAILISEDLVKEDVFTSIHIEKYELEARDTKLGEEQITRDIPNLGEDVLKNLDEEGIVRVGVEVRADDILVGKVTPKGETELTPEERLMRAIFGDKAREVRDTSLRVPHGEGGIVVDVKVFTRKNKDELAPGVNKMVRVSIAQKRKISVGDKMAGRHGNKGVISRVLPREDMPFMADGTPLQIVLNPLGVPSRMNIGQVLEVHLGLIAKSIGWKVSTPVFDGASESDIKELFKANGLPENGKIQLYDGRTGEPFENTVTVGYMYMLKLAHLVDDKIHARSTGPYSLVTQQPLGGKAQFGGQRFGEMEVWALEAYGAANILQEMLTVKSDDVVGRVKTYDSIVKGNNISEPGIPEAFKVLIKELQSIALDVKVLTETHDEIRLRDMIDDEGEIETAAIRKEEEVKQIDIMSNDVFGGTSEQRDTDIFGTNVFDEPADDDDASRLFKSSGNLFDDGDE